MKTVRVAIVAVLLLLLAVGIVPGLFRPYSWQNAAIDFAVLLAFVGPAVGFFFGVRFWQIAFGVVCLLGAILWGALPFIPTDIDHDRSDLCVWVFFEAMLIAATVTGFVSVKKVLNP